MNTKWHKDNIPNPKKSQWDKENREWYQMRNKELIADKQTKTFREMEKIYGLSANRMVRIIKRIQDSNKFRGI